MSGRPMTEGSCAAVRWWVLRWLAAVWMPVVLLLPGFAGAHSGASMGFATVTVEGDHVRYGLTLGLATLPPDLAAAMHLSRLGVAPTFDPLVAALRAKVRMTAGGAGCAVQSAAAMPPGAGRSEITVVAEYRCPATVRSLDIRDDFNDVMGPDYHTLAHITSQGHSQQFSFGTEARQTTVTFGESAAASRGAGSFFPLGIEHILTGYDHLLFLLVLILRGGRLIELLKIITGFTVAHSITLALAALDVVQLPGVLVESVIALSIAYVAAENLFPRFAVSRRWAVSFAFGLMHGFGFSSVLKESGLPQENLVLALLNFNLGVEAGQAAVALVLVPLLLRLRKTPWEDRVVIGVSSVVMVVGIVLFADRAFLGE